MAKAPRADKKTHASRLEQVRAMIRENVNPCDIKKVMRANHGIASRTTEKYLARARRMNREAINVTADDALGASMSTWSREQQQAAGQYRVAQKELLELKPQLAAILDRLLNDDLSKDDREFLEYKKALLTEAIDRATQVVLVCGRAVTDCQHTIDRLLGNLAPIKVARTDAKGKDIKTMTVEEREEELKTMGLAPFKGLPLIETTFEEKTSE